MRNALGWMQRRLGRSRLATSAAVLIRNQARSVIRSHLADGPDANTNGEADFLREVISARGASPFIFFDVGANVGDWTAIALQTAASARGVLFDPSTEACAALRRRFQANSIEIVQAALADTVGEAVFYQEPGAGTHSSLVSGFARAGSEQRRVPVTTVDAEAAKRSIDRLDFLKVDCEGYDLHVLRGARTVLSQQRVDVVQFEYNEPWADAGSTLAAAIRYLNGLNYEVLLLRSSGLHRFRYERYGEFLDYANFVAVPTGSASHLIRGTV
jgi:FkbM family methyltransferase